MNTDEMKNRAQEGAALAATLPNEQWYSATDGRTEGHIVFAEDPDSGDCRRTTGTVAVIPWEKRQLPEQAARLGRFIADARARVPALAADVLALLAEVERLRGENSTLTATEEQARVERDTLKAEVERLRAEESRVVRITHEEARAVAHFIRGAGYYGPAKYGDIEERLSAALAAADEAALAAS